MRGWLGTSVVAAAVLAAACGGAGSDGSTQGEKGAPSFCDEREGGAQLPVAVTVDVSSRIEKGEPVSIALRVRNTSHRPLELHLGGRPIAFNLVVRREHGEDVWQRLRSEAVRAILVIRTLEAGESLSFSDEWRQRDNTGKPVPAGSYVVQGFLPMESGCLESAPRKIVISP